MRSAQHNSHQAQRNSSSQYHQVSTTRIRALALHTTRHGIPQAPPPFSTRSTVAYQHSLSIATLFTAYNSLAIADRVRARVRSSRVPVHHSLLAERRWVLRVVILALFTFHRSIRWQPAATLRMSFAVVLVVAAHVPAGTTVVTEDTLDLLVASEALYRHTDICLG